MKCDEVIDKNFIKPSIFKQSCNEDNDYRLSFLQLQEAIIVIKAKLVHFIIFTSLIAEYFKSTLKYTNAFHEVIDDVSFNIYCRRYQLLLITKSPLAAYSSKTLKCDSPKQNSLYHERESKIQS
ncbi:MAG: hypothetical protein N3G21_03460 [Candidatus Hydrogenedentes bacterium]|nr:hypothetical protein [Candidatus Hydrogenedentota bacterium]